MALPPEPELSALLEVFYRAIVDVRNQVLQEDADTNRISAMMDAVHNIPHLVQSWGNCDQKLMLDMLDDFDRKYGTRGLSLRIAYDQALESALKGEK